MKLFRRMNKQLQDTQDLTDEKLDEINENLISMFPQEVMTNLSEIENDKLPHIEINININFSKEKLIGVSEKMWHLFLFICFICQHFEIGKEYEKLYEILEIIVATFNFYKILS